PTRFSLPHFRPFRPPMASKRAGLKRLLLAPLDVFERTCLSGSPQLSFRFPTDKHPKFEVLSIDDDEIRFARRLKQWSKELGFDAALLSLLGRHVVELIDSACASELHIFKIE